MTRILAPFLITIALTACSFGGEDYPDWKPRESRYASKLIGPLEYLPHARDWERLTVWMPKNAPAEGRLPCIIHVYGGGHVKRNCPPRPGEEWLKRGTISAPNPRPGNYTVGIVVGPQLERKKPAGPSTAIQIHFSVIK